MEHIVTIVGTVISVCGLFSYWKRLKEHEEEFVPPVENNSALTGEDTANGKSDEVETEDVNMDSQQVKTKDLVIDTLKKLGCKPEEDDDGRLHFDYQEGHFMILCSDTSYWIKILFLFWYEFSTYDIDQFSRMQKAVNEANSTAWNVFYTVNKETETVYLHSRIDLIFVPQISDLDDYLRASLKMLFDSRNFVYCKINKTESKENESILD